MLRGSCNADKVGWTNVSDNSEEEMNVMAMAGIGNKGGDNMMRKRRWRRIRIRFFFSELLGLRLIFK